MQSKLYVGNLPYSLRSDDLQAHFANYGSVQSAVVLEDQYTGRSKGFGFVEMGNSAEAEAAIQGMNGKEFDGRAIVVNEARPQEKRTSSGYGRDRY